MTLFLLIPTMAMLSPTSTNLTPQQQEDSLYRTVVDPKTNDTLPRNEAERRVAKRGVGWNNWTWLGPAEYKPPTAQPAMIINTSLGITWAIPGNRSGPKTATLSNTKGTTITRLAWRLIPMFPARRIIIFTIKKNCKASLQNTIMAHGSMIR